MAIAVVPEETKIGTARAEAVIENLYQAEGR
jgi:hypothetical protein